MKKNGLIIMTTLFSLLMCVCAFAYRFEKVGNDWYVYNENSNVAISNDLVDTGAGVYYFDETSKMVTGWFKSPANGNVYFFNNNEQDNYGAMIFGLVTIDGYFRYFNEGGALAHADAEGEYKNVYENYWADASGNLYFNNVLMHDASAIKSTYYTNPIYYTDAKYTNEYLARNGGVGAVPKPELYGKGESLTKSNVANANFSNDISFMDDDLPSGGTNYTVDELGRVTLNETEGTLSNDEIYGPMGKIVTKEEQ